MPFLLSSPLKPSLQSYHDTGMFHIQPCLLTKPQHYFQIGMENFFSPKSSAEPYHHCLLQTQYLNFPTHYLSFTICVPSHQHSLNHLTNHSEILFLYHVYTQLRLYHELPKPCPPSRALYLYKLSPVRG